MLTLLFFNMVTLVLTFTAGGPFSATTTLSLEAYNTSFQFFHFAQGSTLSVILFAMNILLSILYLKVIRTDASN
jgi:multiple sugar transport system permease protein